MGSLIQQRMAIDRERSAGVAFLCLAAALGVMTGLAALSSPLSPLNWGTLVIGVAFAVTCFHQYRQARISQRRFEENNGTDAGKQTPV